AHECAVRAAGRASTPVPHLRRAEHRAAAARDRRVHRARAEALRRHRPDPRRRPGARVRERAGPRGDPAHEPDARCVPDQPRRSALRPVHVRRRPDPLDRRAGLAAAVRARARRRGALLPRARPAHGHPGRAGHAPGVRGGPRRLRARALRVRSGRPCGRRRHAGAVHDVPAQRPRPRGAGEALPTASWTTRCERRSATRGSPRSSSGWRGERSGPAARSSAGCGRGRNRCSRGCSPTSAATPTGTTSPSSAPSRAAAPCRTHVPATDDRCERRSHRAHTALPAGYHPIV
ncbi:MAG: DUF2236, partial [uncultured Pseudonocardia sp.]